MAYVVKGRRVKKHQVPINKHQNNFPKGYVSTFNNARRPEDSLSDLTNMELVEDNVPRPRPPSVLYGVQPDYEIIGRGAYRYNGIRGQLFMMNVSGVGKIYFQVDGGVYNLIGGINAYAVDGDFAGFRQSKSRVYVFNSKDNLSYIDLSTMATVEYVSIAAPAAPSGTASAGLVSGTKPYNYYYKVTANNAVGESAASVASAAINVNTIRDGWDATTKNVTITWTSVAGATSYTLYGGTDANQLYEIITLSGLTTLSYTDDGSLTLNPFKEAPSSNSTEGAIFTWMYVDKRNSQIFGVDAFNKLYYSAAGTGDFSSLNGGGFTTIDEGGDTVLNFVDGFRTGKGDPVITTSSRGAAGKGYINHVTFESVTYGDQTIFYPNVIEANGQSGTYAPRATPKVRDALIYPTGDAIKTTGTSQNIVNILTTTTLSSLIEPDINRINLTALKNAAAVEYQDRVYFALPVGSDQNNEIWYIDFARKNAWVLRWTVPARDIWLYEDNDGLPHLCYLSGYGSGNQILEFTRAGSQTTTDNGVPFRTRTAFSSLVWDEDGVSLGKISHQYVKLLQPKGNIMANSYGLSKRGAVTSTGSDTFAVEVSFTGIGQWDYSGDYQYGDAVGQIQSFANSIAVLDTEPKGLVNQDDWEIITEDANCDYLLSSVNTRGVSSVDLVYQGINK